ncbi:MAG: rhombosortase [Desulfobacterales bacterium]|jgi:rhomboid family GlyGly-CTERM serine protease
MATATVTGLESVIIRKTVRRIPRASLLLSLAALIIHLTNGLRAGLLYERTALAGLELWRVVTCHWVHLNWDHLLWSGATFLCLGVVCEILDRKRTYQTLAIAALLIPVTIWWVQPDLDVYGGLSGLDCALYALLFTLLIKREIKNGSRMWAGFYAVGLVALLAKVTYETSTGQTIFVANTHSGMIPVPLSHLAGGFAGFIVGVRKAK